MLSLWTLCKCNHTVLYVGKAGSHILLLTCCRSSDPESEIPFSEALYSDKILMKAFYNAMPGNGILVMQLGESPNVGNADETLSKFKYRAATESLLEEVGFESVHAYEEVRQLNPELTSCKCFLVVAHKCH